MKWTVLFAAIVAALSFFSIEPVIAQDVSDVVRARGNARAGGSTSGHNAYILKKHGGALSGTKSHKAKKKAAAKKRAQKKAAAKHRAQKKAAAKRRAAIAAKKKQEARRRAAIAAKKKKSAKARAHAARKGHSNSKDEPTEGAAVAAPSTAAVLTNQDVQNETAGSKAKGADTTVAVANDADDTAVETTDDVSATSDNTDAGDAKECKRFVPEIGATVTVDC